MQNYRAGNSSNEDRLLDQEWYAAAGQICSRRGLSDIRGVDLELIINIRYDADDRYGESCDAEFAAKQLPDAPEALVEVWTPRTPSVAARDA